MRSILLTILLLPAAAYPAPPDPIDEDPVIVDTEQLEELYLEAVESQEALEEILDDIETDIGIGPVSVEDIQRKLRKMEKNYPGISNLIAGLDEGFEIEELLLEGDSVYIKLSNDSTIIFNYTKNIDEIHGTSHDLVHFGSVLVIEEDEIIEGDVINVMGDVEVYGSVEGAVITLSGDIYIASTGNVGSGVMAISGKVKREPGSTVSLPIWNPNSGVDFGDRRKTVYRLMALVFLIVFVIWHILSATCASLMKKNINMVVSHVKKQGVIKSFLVGYLAYIIALVVFIALNITVLGIPLAILGVPLALLAATVLSSTAIANIIGSNILNTENQPIKAFLWGSLVLSLVPGLMFLAQFISGNIVLMILSWILIGIFIFIILPVGLGAVFATRFGTRPGKEQSVSI